MRLEALALLAAAAFAFGAAVGSFLNVVIYRVPRGLSVARPKRSFCPSCGRSIPWYQNVPIASWLVLNGRCAGCGSRIPARYLLVEIAGAFLFVVVVVHRLRDVLRPDLGDLVEVAAALLVASLTLAIAVIDFRHAIIPDPLTVPWIPLVVAAVLLEPDVLQGHALDVAATGGARAGLAGFLAGLAAGAAPALFVDFLRRQRVPVPPGEEPESALPTADETFSLAAETRELFLPLLLPALAAAGAGALLVPRLALAGSPAAAAAVASAAGAGAGLLLVYAIRFVFSGLFRREAMGLGDAKYLALIGALVGAEGTLLVFVLGSALGALPAFGSLLLRMPAATVGLLAAALVPLWAMEPAARALGPGLALALLMPIPLLALAWFLRHLRQSPVPLTAMPFGPFLALAALVLVVAPGAVRALIERLLAAG